MHTRDYSEDTSRVIDDEVERILRSQEERAMELLTRHRGGLDAVAHALLEQESISGADVGRLVDEAYGRPVHVNGKKATVQLNAGTRNGARATNGHAPASQPHQSDPRTEPAPVPGAPPPAGAYWPPPQWPPPAYYPQGQHPQGYAPPQPPQGYPQGYPPPQHPPQHPQGYPPPPPYGGPPPGYGPPPSSPPQPRQDRSPASGDGNEDSGEDPATGATGDTPA